MAAFRSARLVPTLSRLVKRSTTVFGQSASFYVEKKPRRVVIKRPLSDFANTEDDTLSSTGTQQLTDNHSVYADLLTHLLVYTLQALGIFQCAAHVHC